MNIKEIGTLSKTTRKRHGLTQEELALASGVGLRFISEFERGKPSCQFSKVLQVLASLGIKLELKFK